MNQSSFSAMTRALSRLPSRRDVLRGLAGSALSGLLTRQAGDALAKKGGKGKGKGKTKNKKGKGKVTLCHRGKTITVSKSAVKGHKQHGDTQGRCPTTNQPSGPTCSDGITNGTETDVDCGGGTCPRCATGKTCASRNDCASARCDTGACEQCADPNTDCGTDVGGGMCGCRDHESGQRFCTKIAGRLLPVGTPCTACRGDEQCFPINGGAGGIECIRPCGAA
jgi:hypothetical protein